MITINIPTELYNELKTVCELNGKNVDETVEELVRRDLQMYRDDNGCIAPKNAKYKLHATMAEKIAYRTEGQVPPAEEWVDCYFIKRTSIYGQPYAVIIHDGQFIKTPAEYVIVE